MKHEDTKLYSFRSYNLVMEEPQGGMCEHNPVFISCLDTLFIHNAPARSCEVFSNPTFPGSMHIIREREESVTRASHSLTNKSIDGIGFLCPLDTPLLKGRARTLGWWRSHQRSALPPARRVQWMRDCWPAPIPMIDPWKEYATLLDWVYFRAKVATIRSITAADGS